MKYTEHKFTLDVNQTASQVSIRVKKGDTARRLLIHLVERGLPYHIGTDCYAVFTARKPDGKVVFNNCSIEECVISYDFTEQTVAAVGLVECEIVLYGTGGKQLTSASFETIVEDTIYDSETEIESTNEYNALADLIQKTQKLLLHGPAAQAIVQEVYGAVVSLTDASNQGLQGLRIFGKSTQDGTPNPDSPVEIVNVGAADGEIVLHIAAQTMTIPVQNGLPGIPVASGGNYTDSDCQQWICDEIDLGRGVYIKRINTLQLPSTVSYYRETSWNNKAAFMVPKQFVEAVPVFGYNTVAKLVSTHFRVSDPGNISYSVVNAIGQGGTDGADLFLAVSGITDAASLQKWVADNKPSVNFILAKPIETQLTDAQIAAYAALHTNKPNTTIYNDAGAYMAAEYVADTKIYVDSKTGSATSGAESRIVKATVE